MDEGVFLVDLVNDKGEVVGQKRHSSLDPVKDMFHAVHVLMVTPAGEVVLSKGSNVKNPKADNAGQFGSTAISIRRSEENADAAAIRALSRELFITDAQLVWVGDKFNTFADGRHSFTSMYYLVDEMPKKVKNRPSGKFKALSGKRIKKEVLDNPGNFAPSFIRLWETYSAQLPL